MTKNEIQFSVRLPEQLVKQLDRIADADERSRNYIIIRALQEFVYRQIDNQKTTNK